MGDHAGEPAKLGKCGQATRLGLRLRAGLTYEEWLLAGRQISKISSASAWWLGDWLLYGERDYGKRYREALERTPFDYKTLRNYAWVARSIEMSRRRDKLSFQHHAEVAGLREAEQDLWLTRAETSGWSRNELRRRLAESRDGAPTNRQGRAAVLRIPMPPEREGRWRRAAEASHQSLPEWVAAAADQVARTLQAQAPPVGPAPSRPRPYVFAGRSLPRTAAPRKRVLTPDS
jgi:hypothetical protein